MFYSLSRLQYYHQQHEDNFEMVLPCKKHFKLALTVISLKLLLIRVL